MKEREALKLMLEALRMPCNRWNKTQHIKVQEAIDTAEKVLAQPEQEPDDLTIAYMAGLSRGKDLAPQRKPLTDEQKYALIEKHLGLKQCRNDTVIDQYTGLFYSAKPYLDLIDEAAHGIKEKNT